MKIAFKAVSAKQIGGIFLPCALFSMNFFFIIFNIALKIFVFFYQYINLQRSLANINMDDLFSIRCIFCQNSPTQFSMLTCSHIICGECLTSFYEPQAKMNRILCPCGLMTNIPNKRTHHFRQSQLLRPCSSMTNLKRRKTQIFDQSSFIINETNGRSSGKPSKIKDDNNQAIHRMQNSKTYLFTELSNQIKFMQLRFKRYLNEINRCYNRLVMDLNKNYQQVSNSIINKCRERISNCEISCLYSIQNFIQKSFKPGLEKKLSKISKNLNEFISYSSNQKENDKQNKEIAANMSQKKRIISCKKISTHQSCKYEPENQFLSQLKSATAKNSKITRKKKSNRFSNHKLIYV